MATLVHVNENRVGTLLRDWRQRRRLSQLDLSLEAGVSTRHLMGDPAHNLAGISLLSELALG